MPDVARATLIARPPRSASRIVALPVDPEPRLIPNCVTWGSKFGHDGCQFEASSKPTERSPASEKVLRSANWQLESWSRALIVVKTRLLERDIVVPALIGGNY